MTKQQKETWIQYFQYLHSLWSVKFANNLSLGQCVDKSLEDNVVITTFIDLFYRYQPFDNVVTNAYTLSFDFTIPENSVFEVTYIQNGSTLFVFNDIKENLLNYIVTELNSTGDLIAFVKDNIIYVYTYDSGYNFADLPTINILTYDPEEIVSVTITSLENNTNIILNERNCLTLDQMCEIKRKLLLLLNNSNC